MMSSEITWAMIRPPFVLVFLLILPVKFSGRMPTRLTTDNLSNGRPQSSLIYNDDDYDDYYNDGVVVDDDYDDDGDDSVVDCG